MQPTSPDPKFDFMLKNNPQPKRVLGLPNFSRPIKLILGIVLAVLLLIVISSVLSSRNKGSTQPIVNAIAREQEILRITQLTQQQLPLTDPDTKAVAATVYTVLSSDQQQLTGYLAAAHTKAGKTQLAADTDKTTDARLQDASQNNNLDSAYKTYLKDGLSKYAADLQAAYKLVGPKGRAIIKSAFDSTNTLLNSPPLKS